MNDSKNHEQQSNGQGGNGRSTNGSPPPNPPLWEKIFALFGLLLTLGLVGYLGFQGIVGGSAPPVLQITVKSVSPRATDYLVRFEVYNSGEQTAAAVLIEGSLSRQGHQVEAGSVELAYVPAKSRVTGGLFFRNNPAEHALTIKPMGYVQP